MSHSGDLTWATVPGGGGGGSTRPPHPTDKQADLGRGLILSQGTGWRRPREDPWMRGSVDLGSRGLAKLCIRETGDL